MKTIQDITKIIVSDLWIASPTGARMIGKALTMIYRGEYYG